MASLIPAIFANINDNDEFNGVGVSNFNDALLMSLLEESQGEEYNDEQLNTVIQSLEAAINQETMSADIDLAMELPEFPADKEDGQNFLASKEFQWPDYMDLVPSSPSDGMNWNMDHCCEYELNNLVGYEGVCDYSQICNFTSLEGHGFAFSSLWQEACDAVTYN